MKYKKLKIALCLSMVGLGTLDASASRLFQYAPISPARFGLKDTVQTDSTELIQVAFRKVKKQNLMGEVQAINLAQLMEKTIQPIVSKT